MIKQLQTFLTNLVTKILGLITKSIDGIEANLDLIVKNPNKLIFITFFSFLVADIILGGNLRVIQMTVSTIKELGSAVTWPVAIITIVITSILKK